MSSVNRPKRKALAAGACGKGYGIELLEDRRLLSASPIIAQPNLTVLANASGGSILGYTPAQIRAAYGFTGVSGNGSGQTIAIIDAYNDPNIAADLHTFNTQFGLSDPNLSVVSQSGGSTRSIATNAGWATEISLDVEWAHAIAPGAKILLVEAASSSLSNLISAVNYARNAAGVSVVSMSWGAGEFSGQTAYDPYFTTPGGHQGVTFVASAGDSGATAAEWPSSSPNVLSVGGTTLNVSSSGSYLGESAWSSGGGGTSQVESEPAYQASAQSTGLRTTPDVSYNADPNTGFAIYDSIKSQGYVGWQEVGGTSAGAPQWSALIALADQVRAAAGKGTLDGATGTLPLLYSLYSQPGSAGYSTYTTYFNDITTGSSGWGPWRVSAAAGYDQVTGLGTPKAAALVNALAGNASAPVAGNSNNNAAAKLARLERRLHHHRAQPVVVVAATAAPSSAAALLAAARAPSAGMALAAVAPGGDLLAAAGAVVGRAAGSTTTTEILTRPVTFAIPVFTAASSATFLAALPPTGIDPEAGAVATATAPTVVAAKPADVAKPADDDVQPIAIAPPVGVQQAATDDAVATQPKVASIPSLAIQTSPRMKLKWTTVAAAALDALLLGYWAAWRWRRIRRAQSAGPSDHLR